MLLTVCVVFQPLSDLPKPDGGEAAQFTNRNWRDRVTAPASLVPVVLVGSVESDPLYVGPVLATTAVNNGGIPLKEEKSHLPLDLGKGIALLFFILWVPMHLAYGTASLFHLNS